MCINRNKQQTKVIKKMLHGLHEIFLLSACSQQAACSSPLLYTMHMLLSKNFVGYCNIPCSNYQIQQTPTSSFSVEVTT